MSALVVVAALFGSCDDDPEAPVITNIRLTPPELADITLTEAPLGTIVVIQGRNLKHVTKVLMNDYEVKLLPSFVSNSNIVVVIDDKVPTFATKADVPNSIRVVTKDGLSASYDILILPPPAIIESISNEMAKAGETITLSGKYFYFVNEITFPGGVKGTNVTTASDGTWAKVTVPPGVDPKGGHILVTSNSGTSIPRARSHFNDTTGVFMNFDYYNPFGWGIQNSNITTSTPGGIIQPINKRFGLIHCTLNKEYGWSNDKVIHITYWGKKMYPEGAGFEAATAIGNMDLRMEVAVEKPTTNLDGIQLTVFLPLSGKDYSYNFPLSNAVKTLDGKWYTVSVPLSSLVNADKQTLSTYGDLLKQGMHEIRLVINNSTSTDIDGTITIDNIRIVNRTR